MRKVTFAIAGVAGLLTASPLLAQTQTVMHCQQTGGHWMAETYANAVYRFDGTPQLEKWSFDAGRWGTLCVTGKSACRADPAAYSFVLYNPNVTVEWTLDRSSGVLRLTYSGSFGYETATAQCRPGAEPQAPRPTF